MAAGRLAVSARALALRLSHATALRSVLLHRSIHSSRICPAVYFTKKHEWINVEEGSDPLLGTVGITNYAQEALGDVVYAELPEPSNSVTAGNDCGTLESVKAASEVYSPCSGKVIEKNEKVEELPAVINSSAEDEGWLFKIELSDPEELKSLMDREKYDHYLKSQEEDH